MSSKWARDGMSRESKRRFEVGAEFQGDGAGTHFRVWAPEHPRVSVFVGTQAAPHGDNSHPLTREPSGYHSGLISELHPGDRYGFLVDDDPKPYADPASRFQPDGPHGLSQIVDATDFEWHDGGFQERTDARVI